MFWSNSELEAECETFPDQGYSYLITIFSPLVAD